jgi:hydroxyacylglutathione hydrolase
MQITPIPLLSDNYAWLLTSEDLSDCAVVDPSSADPVALLIDQGDLQLRWIMATHHHLDHVGGIEFLMPAEVICSKYDLEHKRVPHASRGLHDDEVIRVLNEDVHCLEVPGHTLGAVAFYLPKAKAVFTGDTLFLAGCGRLFEGSPEQMFSALQRLKLLPPDTQIYCGHEYTEKNLKFALSVDAENEAVKKRLQSVQKLRAEGLPTVPAILATELRTNPFLQAPDVATFAKLRALRDGF